MIERVRLDELGSLYGGPNLQLAASLPTSIEVQESMHGEKVPLGLTTVMRGENMPIVADFASHVIGDPNKSLCHLVDDKKDHNMAWLPVWTWGDIGLAGALRVIGISNIEKYYGDHKWVVTDNGSSELVVLASDGEREGITHRLEQGPLSDIWRTVDPDSGIPEVKASIVRGLEGRSKVAELVLPSITEVLPTIVESMRSRIAE